MNDQSTRWIYDTADRVARFHPITARTVRGWIATGAVTEEVAMHLAGLADYGIPETTINAMVHTMINGRPIGDLPDASESGHE